MLQQLTLDSVSGYLARLSSEIKESDSLRSDKTIFSLIGDANYFEILPNFNWHFPAIFLKF